MSKVSAEPYCVMSILASLPSVFPVCLILRHFSLLFKLLFEVVTHHGPSGCSDASRPCRARLSRIPRISRANESIQQKPLPVGLWFSLKGPSELLDFLAGSDLT